LHPDYVRPGKDHDLALLLFAAPGFTFTPWVRPICLWDSDYSIDSIVDKTGEVKPHLKFLYTTFFCSKI